MITQLLPQIKQRFFDSNGLPLAGGKLFSYVAGSSTLLATYTDSTGTAANANPTILDANGEANIWIGVGTYKFILKDSTDVVQWTRDGVSAIAPVSVTSDKIAYGAVGTDELADGGVTTDKIHDLAVTVEKIGEKAVTTFTLDDQAVTSDKIADGAVGTDELADGAITPTKKAALGQQLSADSGVFSTAIVGPTDVTNLSVTITTTGRPVLLMLISGSAATNVADVFMTKASGTNGGSILFLRGTTIISSQAVNAYAAAIAIPSSSFQYVDVVAAGTYTYKVQASLQGVGSSEVLGITFTKLIAFEM